MPIRGDASPRPWVLPSTFGSTYRPATDLLMSTYDTNPATTDHTTALQAAVNAAGALITGGSSSHVRIWFDSRQVYNIGGAVTAGPNGQFAQVYIPFSHTAMGTIELVGMPSGGPNYQGLLSGPTVIRSTLVSAPTFNHVTTGLASTIGGPASYATPNGGFNGFSTIALSCRDITVRSPSPVVCGIDAGLLHAFYFDNLAFDTDQLASVPSVGLTTGLTAHTAVQGVPVIFPQVDAYLGTMGGHMVVAGWSTGPVLGENLTCTSITSYALGGAALNLEAAFHGNKIGALFDWNNAYGIAAYRPDGLVQTPYPTNSWANGWGFGVGVMSGLNIGFWDIQDDNNQGPAGIQRTYHLFDTNSCVPVTADFIWTTAGSGSTTGALKLNGVGSSLTGAVTRARLRSLRITTGPQTPPAVPATTVAIRNPFSVDALVQVTGGTVTAITVNGTATGQTSGAVFVPACATVSLTYTVAPTWTWQTL